MKLVRSKVAYHPRANEADEATSSRPVKIDIAFDSALVDEQRSFQLRVLQIDGALDPSSDDIHTSERHLLLPWCARQHIRKEDPGKPATAICPAQFVFCARI